MGHCEYVRLSKNDLEKIEMELYPRAKRILIFTSIFLLGLSIVGPFVGGKFDKQPLIETLSYPRAFLFYFVFFSSVGLYMYWKLLRKIATDWKNGEKCVFKTKITKKAFKGHEQFQLFLDDLPKALTRKKFIYPVADTHRFQEGDIVVLEYLERSGALLGMYSENTMFTGGCNTMMKIEEIIDDVYLYDKPMLESAEQIPKESFKYTTELVEKLNLLYQNRDESVLEFVLTLADRDGLSMQYSQILAKLLSEKWHSCHEDIVFMLEDIKDPLNVDILFKTALDIPDYDDFRALAKKCIWALGAIGTLEAKEKLEMLSHLEDPIISEFATLELSGKAFRN